MDLLDELETRVVCRHGAMGTLLLDRGVPVDRCLEDLCVSEPDRIRAIHDEYISAGARVIETNTFGVHAVRLGITARLNESKIYDVKRAGATISTRPFLSEIKSLDVRLAKAF